MKFCTTHFPGLRMSAAIAAFVLPATLGFAQTAPKPAVGPPMASPSVVSAPPPPTAPADPSKVILSIGDEKITAGQYEELINALPDQYQQFARGAGKRQFAENIVQLKLLSKEAEKRKLDQTSKVQNQLAFQRQNILAQVMFQEYQANAKVDDAAVQKYYDEHKNEYQSVKARHILIRVKGAPMPGAPGKKELTDDEALAKAQEIKKQLAAGGDFAAIAKAESDDTQSGAQGGDLGSFRRGQMVPPFEQAAFSQPIGQISDPVRSPFGYHIIRVDAKEEKPLADVRADIEKKLRPDVARKQVEAMRTDAKVVMDDGYFGGPQTPPVPPAPAPGK